MRLRLCLLMVVDGLEGSILTIRPERMKTSDEKAYLSGLSHHLLFSLFQVDGDEATGSLPIHPAGLLSCVYSCRGQRKESRVHRQLKHESKSRLVDGKLPIHTIHVHGYRREGNDKPTKSVPFRALIDSSHCNPLLLWWGPRCPTSLAQSPP